MRNRRAAKVGDQVGLVLTEVWTSVNDVDDLLAAGYGLAAMKLWQPGGGVLNAGRGGFVLSRAVLTTPLLLLPCVARVLRHVGRSLIQRHGCVMLRKAFATVEGKRTVGSVGPCRKKVHWWQFAI